VHTTTWSYTEYYDKAGAIIFREYYNLRTDPGQLVNLLRDGDRTNDPSPELLASGTSRFPQAAAVSARRSPEGSPPAPDPAAVSPATRALVVVTSTIAPAKVRSAGAPVAFD